jgi:hypothetical protein
MNMDPLMLLGTVIGIVFIGYAAVNVIFKLVTDALAFLEENRVGIIVVVAIIIVLWFGLRS